MLPHMSSVSWNRSPPWLAVTLLDMSFRADRVHGPSKSIEANVLTIFMWHLLRDPTQLCEDALPSFDTIGNRLKLRGSRPATARTRTAQILDSEGSCKYTQVDALTPDLFFLRLRDQSKLIAF